MILTLMRRVGPVPAEDRCVEPQVRDVLDRGLLVPAHGRYACLDLLHPYLVQQLCDAHLFQVGEDYSSRLLSISQGGVADYKLMLVQFGKYFVPVLHLISLPTWT